MTSWRVRAFEDRDYAAFVRISRPGSIDHGDVAAARAEDATRDRRYDHVRVVAVDEEDAPVGYAVIRHEPSRYDPRRYFVDLTADPAMRRRGIGAALWDRLLAEARARRAEVICLWTADATACQSFIAKRGFVEVVRAYQQVLAVASAPLPTPASEERLTRAGITLSTLAAIRDALGDEALQAVWDLHSACRIDDVALGRATPQPFADWLAQNLTGETALPEAHMVALDGAHFVGVSSARRDGPDTLRAGITGVLPAYRRRGIGRALKLRVHAWARANGFREIHTSPAKPNVAMVRLNDALGYAIVGSSGGYELRLD